ncbi:MAG: glycosyltransferase [Eubacteriales bacterium]|nr:glycosyltransferase [Eubacteriales bacterium]
MKIVQINITSGIGSTGKICDGISNIMNIKNINNIIMYSCYDSKHQNSRRYSSVLSIKINALKSKIFGNYGFNSTTLTTKLLREIDVFNPDIIHLHNIHSHNIDLKLFFLTAKKKSYKLIWTFHDCWAFTGYCVYFTLIDCIKWKNECNNCPQRKDYSWFLDRSKYLYNEKNKLLKGLDLHIVTPSQWLATLVKQSFLKEYPVVVINNGINLNVFKPTASEFRDKYNLTEKYIVLGVAFGWGKRKGLDIFIELSKRLDSDKFKIVLVGTDEKTDKLLPDNILSIHRTHNQTELAQVYTAADVFANPTREENYPTVNMESIACGTPVITFRTGGSPEIIDKYTGSIINCDDIDAMEKEIIRICVDKPYSKKECLEKAQCFNMNDRFKEYINLYKNILINDTNYGY